MVTRYRQGLMYAVLMAAAGCSTAAPPESTLGIEDYQITETDTNLEIIALDAHKARVAKLTLRLGQFVMAEDGRTVDGRQMSLDILGKTASHESEGFALLELPYAPVAQWPEMKPFVLDPKVADVLAKWSIAFVADEAVGNVGQPSDELASGEQPSGNCTFTTASSCGMTSCAEGTDMPMSMNCAQEPYQWVCCGSIKKVIRRACNWSYTSNTQTSCGLTGPRGCAVCMDYSYVSTCTAQHGYGLVTCGTLSTSHQKASATWN